MRRYVVIALAAVAVAAAALAVLGWLSLRQWERSADLLFREQARDMAAMATEKVEMTLRQREDEILGHLRALLASADGLARLEAWVAATPLIERLYLFDRRGALRYPARIADADAGVFAALLAEVSQGLWEQGGRRELGGGTRAGVAAVLRGLDGTPLLAAITWSVDGLRGTVFERTLGGLEAPTILAVVDASGRPVWSRAALDGADHLVTVPFRDALRPWQIAAYQPRDAMPRQQVRRQVMVLTGVLALLLVVIAAGLVATGRLVKQETAMARLKADFVANVSHDLKTPVSVIRMFGETLEMGRVPEESARQEYYRVITRESERLTRLIDNVLDFSRIEGGRRRYDRVPTPVEPLVRQALEAFSYPLAQGGFTVDVDVAADLPEVTLDAEAVSQALANLIDNAIKYSADTRAVRVEARLVNGELALAVSDRGIGIPRGEQPRVFDKFYRVGRSETQARRGSGVGLALVKHIAEAHGGRVTVESAPGEGSRFTLWLPVA